MQNDDSMCDDHNEQGETPKHCRREHEVGELLNHWNFKLYSEKVSLWMFNKKPQKVKLVPEKDKIQQDPKLLL